MSRPTRLQKPLRQSDWSSSVCTCCTNPTNTRAGFFACVKRFFSVNGHRLSRYSANETKISALGSCHVDVGGGGRAGLDGS